jgi:hypothetical protein
MATYPINPIDLTFEHRLVYVPTIINLDTKQTTTPLIEKFDPTQDIPQNGGIVIVVNYDMIVSSCLKKSVKKCTDLTIYSPSQYDRKDGLNVSFSLSDILWTYRKEAHNQYPSGPNDFNSFLPINSSGGGRNRYDTITVSKGYEDAVPIFLSNLLAYLSTLNLVVEGEPYFDSSNRIF